MKYEEMSDFEINRKVATVLGIEMGVVQSSNNKFGTVNLLNGRIFNPCNNPSDAWPIIVDNEISMVADGEGYYAIPPISHFATGGVSGRFDFESEYAVFGYDTPRAAMICFLKMKDAEKSA
tara:strand:- start:32 stop:394 length:363 start_codon:yes stop_codon:yes gene_type:complete